MKYKIFSKRKTIDNLNLEKIIHTTLKNNNWSYSEKDFDYLFIIGGDGSFLKYINYTMNKNKKIIHILIRDSQIGYYYDYQKKDIKLLLKNILENKIHIIGEKVLEIIQVNSNKKFYALNEIKIVNLQKPIKMNLMINNMNLKQVYASGIVLSTSNGSSGFINSINGAIMLKSDLIQLKEIAPVINFNNKYFGSSLILDNDNYINIKLIDYDFTIIADNSKIDFAKNNLEFLIRYSSKKILRVGKENDLKYKISKLKNVFLK